MDALINSIMLLVCIVMGVGCWLGWQLLRQNGRMLLRLDELEKRLDELEFGEPDSDSSEIRPRSAEALREGENPESETDQSLVTSAATNGRGRHSVRAEASSETNGAQGTDAPYPQDRASRFKNPSLARSKIKRDGLKAGTPAPDFRLPCLDGSERSLQDFRGRRVLLIFSDPRCGPCNALAPELERFHRKCLTAADVANAQVGRVTPCAPQEDRDFQNGAHGVPRPTISVVMISRGEPKENRAKVKEHGLTFPVLLQQRWEISRRYAMFATPIAYLIDEAGVIADDVAVGVESIQALLAAISNHAAERKSEALLS
jgi:peroxiredoxin